MKQRIPTFNSDDQRAAYLGARGYKYKHSKGGHGHWEHPDILASASKRRILLPPNLCATTTIAQPAGRVIVPGGCMPYTWESVVKAMNWAAEEYVANDPDALKVSREERHDLVTELRKAIRSERDERRCLTQMQRALCQEFKRVGMKGALQYLEEMGPSLEKTKSRLNAMHMAIETMQQRVGTSGDRAQGPAARA